MSTKRPRGRYLALLCLTALGVVYGDIGTSPLYAIRECFHGPHAVAVTRENVLGVLSLIFWSLVIIVSLKYHIYVIRAENHGEGGILALMAMIGPQRLGRRIGAIVTFLGLIGAALLYGDGMITPAISVLSAVEGLEVATPALRPFVLPTTIAILTALFLVQHRGTAGVGVWFGPVTLAWFVTLAVLGAGQVVREPGVLAALNPAHGLRFLSTTWPQGFLVLGAVFLVVTGGEALYADLGHFGPRPVRIDWFFIAFPSLLLNYFGQGALLLRDPGAAASPFYRLAPEWALFPLILLATAATIIASQAVISGVFSLTRQAVQLGYWPRVRIEHTSSREIGQIYVPAANWALMAATIGLVLGFRSSSALAGAYGVAVSTTMVITTLLMYVAARQVWHWSLPAAAGVTVFFLGIDLVFFVANAVKIPQGGWFPLVVAAVMYLLMSTWKRGREILHKRLLEKSVPLNMLLADLAAEPPIRVPGTAVFMFRGDSTPPALVHNLTHNKVLHEKVVFVTVLTEEVPRVPREERVTVKSLGKGFYSVTARYGFMQDPDIQEILDACGQEGLTIPIENATFFLGRETLIASDRPGMARWRERLFALMSRNAARATAFFRIPATQVFEVGAEVEL